VPSTEHFIVDAVVVQWSVHMFDGRSRESRAESRRYRRGDLLQVQRSVHMFDGQSRESRAEGGDANFSSPSCGAQDVGDPNRGYPTFNDSNVGDADAADHHGALKRAPLGGLDLAVLILFDWASGGFRDFLGAIQVCVAGAGVVDPLADLKVRLFRSLEIVLGCVADLKVPRCRES
jgi:hypothetical protein